MYYHQKDVTVHSNHPVESNYEYNFNNDNGYVGMNEVYERNPMQTTQRFPVQNGSSPMGNGGVSYNNEFAMSRTSNYKSSSGVPENMRLVDSEVASQRYVAPRSNKRETTKVIRETLEDGTVISRQIVVEEEDTLIERRLYKYEATSPLMSRKMDPAQAMAVQTGVHQAAEYAEDDDDITAKFSRYEAELEARRQQQQQQQQRKTHDDLNGWGNRYGSRGGNLEGSGTEEGHYVEGYGPVSPNEGRYVIDVDCASQSSFARNQPAHSFPYCQSGVVISPFSCSSDANSRDDSTSSPAGTNLPSKYKTEPCGLNYEVHHSFAASLQSSLTSPLSIAPESYPHFSSRNTDTFDLYQPNNSTFDHSVPFSFVSSLRSNNFSLLPSKPKVNCHAAKSPLSANIEEPLLQSSANYALNQTPMLGATDKQAIDNQATCKPRNDSDKGKTWSSRMTQYLPGPQPNPVVTEPRSVKSVKGLKTLSNKARSSSQSRLTRPKLQEQRGRLETSIDQALFESKLKSRSKSQPVLSSSRSLSSLVPYPSQVLPKDVIHPVNQLSSTGFAPLARSAYNPYKSQSSLVCEKLPSHDAKPDVAPTKLGRSCSEKRMKDLELTKSPTLSGSRRRNVSEMTTPDETPFGMVVDASSNCSSINEISEHFSSVIWKDPNSAGLGKLSDCELFDPQSDSGIDLPGKHIADVTLVAPIALNRKRPDILWAAEPQALVTEVISSPVSVTTNDSTEINLNSDLNRVRMFQSDVGHKYCGRLRDGGNELLAKGLSRELPGRVLCKSIDNGLDGGVGSRISRDVCLIPSFCEPTNFGDDFDLYENCHRSMVSSSLSQLNPHVVSVSSSIIANSPSPIYSFSPSVESCSHVNNDVERTKSRHNKQSHLSCSPKYFSSSAAQKFNNIPSSNYHVLLSSHNQRGNGPYDDSKGHRQHRDQLPNNTFTLNRDSNSNSNSDGSYNQFPSPSVESSFYTDPQLLRPSPFNNPDQQPKLPDPYSRGHNSKAKGGPRQSYVKSNSLPRNRLDSVRNQQSSSSVPNRNGVGSKNPHLSPGANLEFKNPHHSMSAFTKGDVSPFELLKLSSSNQPGSISDHYASPQLVVHTDPKFPSPSTAGSNSPHRIVPPTEHEFGLMDPESKLKLIQNLTEGDYASRPDDYVGSFSSLRKSDISRISPSTDAVAKSAPPRQMRYNESFKHASNNAFFGSDDLKPSPRSNQFEHLSHHRNDRSGDALISPGGRMDSQRPSESHYTYDLPGGSDFNRNNKQNGHLTTEPYQGKRESGFTTTHGFPLLSGHQKSTPDISQHLDNDYVPNYDNTHLVAKQRGFKMSADNLIDEDSIVARDASRSQQNAGLDFAPRPSPKPKLLPLQKHHAPQSNK